MDYVLHADTMSLYSFIVIFRKACSDGGIEITQAQATSILAKLMAEAQVQGLMVEVPEFP